MQFREVMSVKEGQVLSNGIMQTGFKDNTVAEINLSKVSWIESYDKHPHENGKPIKMAVFDGSKGRIMLFRDMD